MEYGIQKEGYEISYHNGMKIKRDDVYFHLLPHDNGKAITIDVYNDGATDFIHRGKQLKHTEAESTLHFLDGADKINLSLLKDGLEGVVLITQLNEKQ